MDASCPYCNARQIAVYDVHIVFECGTMQSDDTCTRGLTCEMKHMEDDEDSDSATLS